MAASGAGRKPKPPRLKLLEGRGNGRDSGGRKVKLPPGFVRLPPEVPEWLSGEARAEWDRVVPELQRLQLTKPLDRAALVAYCEIWARFVTATIEVHAGGLVVENRSVKKDGTETIWFTKNPAVAIQTESQTALRRWCAEFGLTPSAEGRLSTPEVDDGEEDPFG